MKIKYSSVIKFNITLSDAMKSFVILQQSKKKTLSLIGSQNGRQGE